MKLVSQTRAGSTPRSMLHRSPRSQFAPKSSGRLGVSTSSGLLKAKNFLKTKSFIQVFSRPRSFYQEIFKTKGFLQSKIFVKTKRFLQTWNRVRSSVKDQSTDLQDDSPASHTSYNISSLPKPSLPQCIPCPASDHRDK